MVSWSADVRPIYTIDARDRIAFVNAAWLQRAHRDGAASLTADAVVGKPVWNFIEGVLIRQLWELMYERVRAVGAPVFIPMRTDTPDQRRLVDLELHPLADRSILHISECAWTEARPAVALLDPDYPRDARTLACCAWCKRVQVRIGAWQEIEAAQRTLAIEACATLPTIRASVCSGCQQSVLATFPARVA